MQSISSVKMVCALANENLYAHTLTIIINIWAYALPLLLNYIKFKCECYSIIVVNQSQVLHILYIQQRPN